jgi:hypothetical protein
LTSRNIVNDPSHLDFTGIKQSSLAVTTITASVVPACLATAWVIGRQHENKVIAAHA